MRLLDKVIVYFRNFVRFLEYTIATSYISRLFSRAVNFNTYIKIFKVLKLFNPPNLKLNPKTSLHMRVT